MNDGKSFCRRNNHFFFIALEFFIMLLFFSGNSFGQHADSVTSVWDVNEDSHQQISFLNIFANEIEPQILSDVQTVRAYIRDEQFQLLRHQYGDVCAVDFIYLKALQTAQYDMARALFVSFLAVLEHRVIHIKTAFHLTIPIMLTFETDSAFIGRVRHLPNNIYSDSPKGIARDRDKLQHFFGSAFLSYILAQPEMVHSIGDLLEWAEPGIVVGGENDPRDKRANLQGEQFGRDLSIVPTLLPSDYLTLPFKDSK